MANPNEHGRKLLILEHRRQRPLSLGPFIGRVALYTAVAALLVLGALGVGMLGYHELEDLPWIDSFLNASMILGGMGPVNELHTEAGKLFAGLYALFSGLVFLVGAGLILAPMVHRLLHRFHFKADSMEADD
jgi:hypothetical protein